MIKRNTIIKKTDEKIRLQDQRVAGILGIII